MVLFIRTVMIAALLMSMQASADHKIRFIVGVEKLEYFPQYSYDPQHGYRGAYKAILDLFAKKRGYAFIYKAFPINDLYSEFIKKSLDFKYPDNALWNSQAKHHVQVYYSEQVLPFTDGVMVLKNRYGKGLNNLKVLGIPKGFTPNGYAHLISNQEIVLAEGDELKDVLGQLLIGNTDGAYVNKSVANYQLLNKFKMSGRAVFDDTLPFTQDSYRLSSIKHPKVIKEFNAFLHGNRQKINDIKHSFGVL